MLHTVKPKKYYRDKITHTKKNCRKFKYDIWRSSINEQTLGLRLLQLVSSKQTQSVTVLLNWRKKWIGKHLFSFKDMIPASFLRGAQEHIA